MQLHKDAHQMRMVASADALANTAVGSRLVCFAYTQCILVRSCLVQHLIARILHRWNEVPQAQSLVSIFCSRLNSALSTSATSSKADNFRRPFSSPAVVSVMVHLSHWHYHSFLDSRAVAPRDQCQ